MRPAMRILLAVGVAAVVVVVVVAADAEHTGDPDPAGLSLGAAAADVGADAATTSSTAPSTTSTTAAATTTTTTVPPYEGWVDPASSGEPWGDTVPGILTFRGSPTRSFYGAGPVPQNPSVVWSFPAGGAMCSLSSVGSETTQWCGTGWTGQPSVFERDGRTWVVFGAYDRNVHFLDADTGDRIIPDFPTGDIIKGSVTIDPDGHPLVYFGSRDNFLRVVSFDGPEPVELWSLDARSISPRQWNDDWDGAPLVVDDFLFEGGENSNIHIVRLNRGYDADGNVTVDPELVFAAPGWDDELTAAVGSNVSIENSVMITGNTLWFANSGGLLQGWDITGLAAGIEPERVFRFWLGDDTDATLVADDEGFLYAGVEYERGNSRSAEVGQIVKLDPTDPDDPIVWSIEDRGTIPAGVWATPAVHGDTVYASTDGGRLMGIDRYTGEIRWEKRLPAPLWSSQVVVDDVLIQGDCSGIVHAYDVSDTSVEPPELWTVDLGGGCIESTPAVWDGAIYVGSRGGFFHKIADG